MRMEQYRRTRQVGLHRAWPELLDRFHRNQLRFDLILEDGDGMSSHIVGDLVAALDQHCQGLFSLDIDIKREPVSDGSYETVLYTALYFENNADLTVFEKMHLTVLKLSS